MMFYGLDALANGALAAILALLPALALFWRLTRGLAAGGRALRPFVASTAAFGLAVAAGATWATAFERSGYADEATLGAVMAAALVAALAFLVLLLLPRRT